MIPNQDDFKGTQRFKIKRRLGAGAFGIVYEAYDEEDDLTLALKVLRQADPNALLRFKREFRLLTEVTHPHLVTLYELIVDEERWFFTMELVKGVNFLDYVWKAGEFNPSDRYAETIKDNALAGGAYVSAPHLQSALLTSRYERLRCALSQLAEGVNALHTQGRLHRDIKPTNVLVTTDDHVKILDFGMVTELDPLGIRQSMSFVGTVAYMSPEQAAHHPASMASDWYCIGVMMYEALTGKLPISGRINEVLKNKQLIDPPTPKELVADVPDDLNELCRELISRDPKARPSGQEVLERLNKARGEMPQPSVAVPSLPGVMPFVGRESHLVALTEAYSASTEGRATVVYVHGKSGMGKSALVQHFLDDLQRQERDVVVLSGRCYEQESVPYKALDSLVDSLSQYLKQLPPASAEALMPRDVQAVARLFPVLKQVDAIAGARWPLADTSDIQELRQRSFAALRKLVTRLTDHKQVVLSIDDLQWGDVDSAALLGELLRSPETPPVLLIASYRSDEAQTSPLLRVLLPLLETESGAEIREVEVGELEPTEAKHLALALMHAPQHVSSGHLEAITKESGGSPLFISELARYSRENLKTVKPEAPSPPRGDEDRATPITLDEMIHARVTRLPEEARHLLETIAVGGKPLDLSLIREAAGTKASEPRWLALLRTAHFIRIRETEKCDEIETYHDRIRETVVAHLAPENLKDHHHRLALALESSKSADPETLAVHFKGADCPEQAAGYSHEAADQAANAFAFNRAARLYQLALELRATKDSTERALRKKRGDALANAGRGFEAAQEYLAAIEGADAIETMKLRQRAAEQLLRSGHIDDGLNVLRDVLETTGMKLADTPGRALVSLLARRVQLRMRGFKFQARDAAAIPPEDLLRIDTCWSIAIGLAMVDVIRGADFEVRHLLLALKAGEPSRVVRALAAEVAYAAAAGVGSRPYTEKVLQEAATLSKQLGTPEARGRVMLAEGYAAYFFGEWKKTIELTERAESILLNQSAGVSWELNTARHFALRALINLGDWDELARRLPAFLKEAQERGDRFIETNIWIRVSYILSLAASDENQARAEVRQGIERWLNKGFHVQHYWSIVSQTEIELYCGENIAGWNLLSKHWSTIARTLHLRVQVSRIESIHLRARCAIAAALDLDLKKHKRLTSAQLLGVAERGARKLAREQTPWASALAHLIQAGVAKARGNPQLAVESLRAAETEFEAAQTSIYAAAAKRRLGELLGGDEGKALVKAADDFMERQTIKDPARMTSMLAPG